MEPFVSNLASSAEPDQPQSNSSSACPARIGHVDSLRAIAAGLVVWLHFTQNFGLALTGRDPAFLRFLVTLPRALDVGRTGVMIFFAVSGFVICRSFGGPRAGAGWRFVLKRCCRLYPAYWVSILGALAIWPPANQPLTWSLVAANATMLPTYFAQPRLLGVYWTLEIELIFYTLCLGLFWTRCLHRKVLLTAAVVLLAWLPRLLKVLDHHAGTHFALSPGQPTCLLGLAIMFWGALFRMAYEETDGFRRNVFAHRGTWLVAILGLALIDLPDPNVKWYILSWRHGGIPTHFCVVLALVIFTLWVAVWRIDTPVLTHLGVTSYAIYLFHPVVFDAARALVEDGRVVDAHRWPHWITLVVYAVLTGGMVMALAGWVYRRVERPIIALGKRWAGTGQRTATAPWPILSPGDASHRRFHDAGSGSS